MEPKIEGEIETKDTHTEPLKRTSIRSRVGFVFFECLKGHIFKVPKSVRNRTDLVCSACGSGIRDESTFKDYKLYHAPPPPDTTLQQDLKNE